MSATNDVFRMLDRELWILTVAAGERRGGMVATSVLHASIVPELPRLLVTVSRHHHTWELLEQSPVFALHLLEEDQREWVWRFGGHSGRDIDKLEGLALRTGSAGGLILDDAPAWLECRVEERYDIGDRWVYLAEVLDGDKRRDFQPLTMQGYFKTAPEHHVQALKQFAELDARKDAPAIEAWRERRRASGAI